MSITNPPAASAVPAEPIIGDPPQTFEPAYQAYMHYQLATVAAERLSYTQWIQSVLGAIRNSGMAILAETDSAQLDALIAAKFAAVVPVNKIYVDVNEQGDGNSVYIGEGTIAKPYNDPLSALNALIDGVDNELHCKSGDYVLGEYGSSTTYINFHSSKTTISVIETDGAGTVDWKIHHYKYSNNKNYAVVCLRFHNNFSFKSDAKITTVTPAISGSSSGASAMFIFPAEHGISASISFHDDVVVEPNNSLISPYSNPSLLSLTFDSVNLTGGGTLIATNGVGSGGLNTCNAVGLTSDGNTKIYDTLLAGKENLLTNIPTSPILV